MLHMKKTKLDARLLAVASMVRKNAYLEITFFTNCKILKLHKRLGRSYLRLEICNPYGTYAPLYALDDI